MSRQIFGKTPPETSNPEATTQVERRAVKKPLMGLENLGPRREGQPVGALGASLSALSERGKHAEEIEKKLAAGQTVVELDTTLIDPSFVSDRMPISDEALSDLVEAIGESTQLSPILVRPHPETPGRYQTAFGHRRVRAVAILGIPVRAIVRELTDEEMVVAQGQENHARKDLSYIEKALFAQRLEGHRFTAPPSWPHSRSIRATSQTCCRSRKDSRRNRRGDRAVAQYRPPWLDRAGGAAQERQDDRHRVQSRGRTAYPGPGQ